MAKAIISNHRRKKRTKHPGIHAKSKTSKSKISKNYAKKYRGQGR